MGGNLVTKMAGECGDAVSFSSARGCCGLSGAGFECVCGPRSSDATTISTSGALFWGSIRGTREKLNYFRNVIAQRFWSDSNGS